MRRAVIVSYARTGLAKSGRGGFNITHGAALAGAARPVTASAAAARRILLFNIVISFNRPDGSDPVHGAKPRRWRLNAFWPLRSFEVHLKKAKKWPCAWVSLS